MHQQSHKVVPVGIETEQHSQSHVVDSCLHRSVHSLRMVGIVALRTPRMQFLVILLVVSFLEQDVRTDTGIAQTAVVLYGRGCNVDIHPSDGSVLVLDAVNRLNGFQDVLNRVVYRIFARFQSQALVSHILQGNYLLPDFLLRELLPGDVLVLYMIGAIHATVDAVVGQVQRCEHHNPVAVELLLDFTGQ